MVELMGAGQAVTIGGEHQVVTTQTAADVLGMSRPFFIKLHDQGAMAYHRVGNQRRVFLRDVLAYGEKRDKSVEQPWRGWPAMRTRQACTIYVTRPKTTAAGSEA
ncbi:MAG: excisionase family DNA-binding protein [Bryobacteraceae bacterium]